MRKPRVCTNWRNAWGDLTVSLSPYTGRVRVTGDIALTVGQAKLLRNSLDRHIAYLQATNEKGRKA